MTCLAQHPGRTVRLIARAILCYILLSSAYGASSLTEFAESVNRALAGQPAAAVVVRVRDRCILAAYNLPVLRQRIASPGSAIKPFVLALMLETGSVRPQDVIACRRNLVIAGRKLNCSHPPEFTTFNAEEALALSCNSYFVTAAERLQPGELERRFSELGFTQPSGLLPGEGQGRIVPARSLAARQLLAIGVAGIEITPLELASAYLQLARLNPAAASSAEQVVLAGLRAATDYGLAQNARTDQLSVAGKTGTASDPSDAHTHAWFAGFAPAEKPEIVVVVFVERGHGSVEAANLARRIFQAYEKHRQ
ncbi:MAG: penicillin-binding transpeptidase domain-containing protein [Candidatus Sulfotelmatobacter sp.]|jgi:cell division protein FtsI/penicillin-binding protein 2